MPQHTAPTDVGVEWSVGRLRGGCGLRCSAKLAPADQAPIDRRLTRPLSTGQKRRRALVLDSFSFEARCPNKSQATFPSTSDFVSLLRQIRKNLH